MGASVGAHLRRAHGEERESTDGTSPVGFEPGFEAVLVEEMAASTRKRKVISDASKGRERERADERAGHLLSLFSSFEVGHACGKERRKEEERSAWS